jgi:glycosyltransferase involved in cell wall biosynthesis
VDTRRLNFGNGGRLITQPPLKGERDARVLVAAYACEPGKGSEPGVGWNWAAEIARRGYEVHVLTRANNRSAIERELQTAPVSGLHFHYLDLGQFWLRLKRRCGYPGLLVYYYVWQLKLARYARRLQRRYGFQLAHHVTFVNDWMPSGLSVLTIPFIWGPVGGSTNRLPKEVKLYLPLYARVHELVRRMAQSVIGALDPFLWLTRRRAVRILTFTKAALDGLPAAHRRKASPINHIGIRASDVPVTGLADRTDGRAGLTIVSGGRLVHWKGFDLLIEGFAAHQREASGVSQLIITGGGPYQEYLARLAHRMEVASSVHFIGRLPTRETVYAQLLASDIYALPTLRDGPPVAILEAMLAGIPILCLDHGATQELVPACAGFKIPMGSRAEIVNGIAAALNWALNHRAELRALGMSAREHALAHHDWGSIGDEIARIYREILNPQESIAADPTSSRLVPTA